MKEYGSVTDKGGKAYKTVVIGEQTWMAENLDYEVEFSKCYDNKPENCEKYGRLYDWLAATEVCPNGWHLPSSAEWATLKEVVGNSFELMARDSRKYGVDNYGFSALGGGHGNSRGFFEVGKYDYWWSATEKNASGAYSRYLNYNGMLGSSVMNEYDDDKTNFNSVRCLKD